MNKNAKSQVIHQLKAYPYNSQIVQLKNASEPDAVKSMRKWVGAIDRVMESFKAEYPKKAELARRLFFDEGDVAADSLEKRNAIMVEMFISEPTLYRWRDDIINEVLVSALEAGAVAVYGAL